MWLAKKNNHIISQNFMLIGRKFVYKFPYFFQGQNSNTRVCSKKLKSTEPLVKKHFYFDKEIANAISETLKNFFLLFHKILYSLCFILFYEFLTFLLQMETRTTLILIRKLIFFIIYTENFL